MVNQQVLEGHWNDIQGKLRNHWGQLTDSDLERFKGDAEQLVGMIQRKTGEAREEVENYLQRITDAHSSTIEHASEAVRKTARDVAENLSEYAGDSGEATEAAAARAVEHVREGYQHTEELVRRRPVESLAACFGVGLITGVVVGMVLRSR